MHLKLRHCYLYNFNSSPTFRLDSPESWNCLKCSNHTFYSHSQFMAEKLPNFWRNLSAFIRGWQLVAVGLKCYSGTLLVYSHSMNKHWPYMVLINPGKGLLYQEKLISKLCNKEHIKLQTCGCIHGQAVSTFIPSFTCPLVQFSLSSSLTDWPMSVRGPNATIISCVVSGTWCAVTFKPLTSYLNLGHLRMYSC